MLYCSHTHNHTQRLEIHTQVHTVPLVVFSWSDSELCKLGAKQLCNCFSCKDCERTKILPGFSMRTGMHWFGWLQIAEGGMGKIEK